MPGFFGIDEEEFDKQCHYDYTRMEADVSCMQCGMFKTNKNPKLSYTGEGKRGCLIVAEANGRKEDEVGYQLVGDVGNYFRSKLKDEGVELDRDFFKINAVNCCPYTPDLNSFREPKDDEIKYCRPFVEKAIQETKPKFIWLLGRAALKSFFMDYFSHIKMSTWRGWCIPDTRYNAYILPMHHPSFAMRCENERKANELAVWKRDLKNAVKCLDKKDFDPIDSKQDVHCLYKFGDVNDALDLLNNGYVSLAAFDYETTGIKPFVKGHKIVSISFAIDNGASYSFPFEYPNHFSESEISEIRKKWKRFLKSDIYKVAQNIQFEEIWSSVIMNTPVSNWYHCTMLGAHVLDSRSGITSLDFQNYKNFGIYPYGSEIEQYKKAENSNAFNNMTRCPIDKLLVYGGLDSKWALKNYHKQDLEFERRSERNPKIIEALELLMEGAVDFSEMTINGIHIEEDLYAESRQDLRKKIEERRRELEVEHQYAKQFKERYGYTLSLKKDDDKKKLFFEIIGIEKQETQKGNVSISKKALGTKDSNYIRLYQKMNSWLDIDNKYIAQFLREVTYGKIHPFYHLHRVRSYRSSSSDPNWQNIPEHDEDAKKICKSGIVPSRGNKLMEWDFSGIEVCAGCFYHKDPQMIKYVTDKSTDMHRDSAVDITMLPPEEITKEIRFIFGKNGWVFPQFYGDYYGNCALAMWRELRKKVIETKSGKHLKEHFTKVGLKTLEDFTEHCKKVEQKFWQERFGVYNEWKQEVNREFRKKGYIESLLGFEHCGILGKNDCTNHQIQGTAFHILLWTKLRVADVRREEGWKTKSIAQIHDSGLEDQVPDEQSHIIKTINDIGTKQIRERFDFINVPLVIDFEDTEIDAAWSTKKPIDDHKISKILEG